MAGEQGIGDGDQQGMVLYEKEYCKLFGGQERLLMWKVRRGYHWRFGYCVLERLSGPCRPRTMVWSSVGRAPRREANGYFMYAAVKYLILRRSVHSLLAKDCTVTDGRRAVELGPGQTGSRPLLGFSVSNSSQQLIHSYGPGSRSYDEVESRQYQAGKKERKNT